MEIQTLIVFVLAIAAAVFLARSVLGSTSARSSAPGCHGCDLGCHSAGPRCPPGAGSTSLDKRPAEAAHAMRAPLAKERASGGDGR